MDLRGFLEEWGYLAVLIGTFFEGETILVLGGIAAQMQHLKLEYVMICAFIGSLFGDQLWFFVGRFGGRWVMRRRRSWRPSMRRVSSYLERNQVWFILIFRFLWGLRTVAPFAIGMSRVKTSTYIFLNVIGAAVWAVAVALLGYAFGQAAELVMDRAETAKPWLLGGVAVLAVAFWLWRKLRVRKLAETGTVSKAESAVVLPAANSTSVDAANPTGVPAISTTPPTGSPLMPPRRASAEEPTPHTGLPLRDPGP